MIYTFEGKEPCWQCQGKGKTTYVGGSFHNAETTEIKTMCYLCQGIGYFEYTQRYSLPSSWVKNEQR